ncbi:MAG: DUF2236 domain-containing protein [Candidatus Nomurabacteria bacterium]|nr:MAG: DUF2236 domain-containing protein [Candidatus Nomurabacteria bacterium]
MAHPRYGIQASESERQFLIVDRHGDPVVNDRGEELIGAPLDGDSIVKRKFGKVAYGTQIGIGIEQLLHPQIGAAVEHTEKFWKNPYNRVAVSMDPIMAVVYADDPYAAGDRVRQFHERINGKDYMGRKFNALDPEAFYWAHETFRRGVQNLAEQYSLESFTDADREQLQLESATWFSYYGMPMNMVPADYGANLEYRKYMIDNVLEMNPSAERAINLALDRTPPRPESVPKAAWPLAKLALMPVTELMSLLTIGELPADIRTKFGIPFTKDNQKRLNELRNIIKTFEGPLPDPLQYLTVYDAVKRDRGGEHKNMVDHVTHTGIAAGKEVVKRIVFPVFKKAQQSAESIRSFVAA